jgi:hypothetical protein
MLYVLFSILIFPKDQGGEVPGLPHAWWNPFQRHETGVRAEVIIAMWRRVALYIVIRDLGVSSVSIISILWKWRQNSPPKLFVGLSVYHTKRRHKPEAVNL